MKGLTQVIDNLTTKEVRLIPNFYHSSKKSDTLKRLDLFNLVLDTGYMDDEEACQLLYGKPPHSAFSHLKRRLKNDITSILLTEDGTAYFPAKANQAEYDARKAFLGGLVLFTRGARIEAEKYFSDAAKLADVYDLSIDQLLIYDYLRSFYGLKKGVKVYDEYTDALDSALLETKYFLEAKHFYYQLFLRGEFEKSMGDEDIAFAKNAVEKLRSYYVETGKPRIGYYYHYVALFYYNMIYDFDSAFRVGSSFLELVTKSKAISSKTRIATANLQLSFIHIHRGDFELGTLHAANAKKLFKPGFFNELQAHELLFFCAFRSGNFESAKTYALQGLKHKQIKTHDVRPAKWHFFLACTEFQLGYTSDAIKQLTKTEALSKDKTGWEMGVRLLRIYIKFRDRDLYLAAYDVDNLRKLISRHKEAKVERMHLICLILDTLINSGGNFEETAIKQADKLKLLSSLKDPYRWDPMSFELIRFDHWFEEHAHISSITA